MTLNGAVAFHGNSARWPEVALRAFLRRTERVGKTNLPLLGVGLHEGVRQRDDNDGRPAASEDLSGYKIVQEGDVVMNRLGKPHGSVGVSPWRGITSPAYWVMEIDRNRAHPAFIHHLLRSKHMVREYERLGKYMPPNQFDISWDTFRSIEVPLPSLDEQWRIADFLDAETARIDALMARRLAQTSALSELELARIGEHLGGVDLSTGRTETGWRWLPSIPNGWCIGPVYAYFDVQLGKMLNAERASGESQQAYLRNANVHWYGIDTEDMATMAFESHEQLRYGVQAGDLLVCEGGAGVAEAAVWDGRSSPCFYQKSLHRVRAASHLPVEWLMYWLRFAKAAGVFDADGNLATIPHLTGEQLAEYRIPIPRDGHRRVAELSSEIAAIRQTQIELAFADALLSERRQALITTAVTGQVDVTTASGLARVGGTAI